MSWIVTGTLESYNDNGYVRVIVCCDTVADLPNRVQPNSTFDMGSEATVIETGDKYLMKSDGSWVKQPSSEWSNVYTKSEIDDMITPIEDAVIDLIDTGNKNMLPIPTRIGPSNATAAATYTQAGVQFTCNLDGTITIERVSANSNQAVLWLYDASSALLVDDYTDGEYVWSNGVAGSSTTARMRLAKLNAGDYLVIDSYATIPESSETGCNISLIVYPTFTGTMTFKPMICLKSYWEMTKKYVPHV